MRHLRVFLGTAFGVFVVFPFAFFGEGWQFVMRRIVHTHLYLVRVMRWIRGEPLSHPMDEEFITSGALADVVSESDAESAPGEGEQCPEEFACVRLTEYELVPCWRCGEEVLVPPDPPQPIRGFCCVECFLGVGEAGNDGVRASQAPHS